MFDWTLNTRLLGTLEKNFRPTKKNEFLKSGWKLTSPKPMDVTLQLLEDFSILKINYINGSNFNVRLGANFKLFVLENPIFVSQAKFPA